MRGPGSIRQQAEDKSEWKENEQQFRTGSSIEERKCT